MQIEHFPGKRWIMVKHYFKVTFRHIRKHLLISLLNMSGLAIGIACFVLIMLYVNHELNYDRYNEHFEDIYRVAVDARIGSTVIRQLGTPAPMPAAMYEEYPEIRAITRILTSSLTVTLGDRVFNEPDAAAVDSTFTDIFTLKFLEGSTDGALNEPREVLLDRSTAQKYFGEEPAYGKNIYIQDTIPLTVTGIYEDLPAQSHFHFNILVSLVSIEGRYNNDQWFNNNYATYMRLEHGAPEEKLEAKLPDFVDKYLYGGDYEQFADEENYWHLSLQKLREIHLGSDLSGEFESNGNLSYIRLFSVVAFLVLVVASINFMNLTTASSSIRAREVGIRKANGASRGKLQQQFFTEAVIVTILATVLAMGLVESVMEPYRNFVGREIELHYLDNFLLIPGLLALAIVVGLLSGSYPAFYMSGFSPVDSLGFKGVKQSKSWFRNILVLFQFSVAIFLIAGTLLVQRQMKLLTEESLGFDKERVILVNNAYYLENNLETYRQELLKLPQISDVSASYDVPGNTLINWGFGAQDVDEGFSLNANLTDEHYMETMGMELVAGRYFSEEYGSDSEKIILNETAVKLLGYEEPIGKITYLWNDRTRPLEVIGVVKDYFYESKHRLIRPHALMYYKYMNWTVPQYLSVRVKDTDYERTIRTLEEGWKKYVENIPFDYAFLDTHYEGIYHNEMQTRTVLYIFAVITIIISCLGLFGLASFMAERRTKEIGIRKTNGASTGNILRMLSIDFTRWVLLANLIAWPLTWLAMKKWLQGFAYRVGIPWWVFLLAGAMAFVIALTTVSFHALKASRQNPGMSLRYE
jgi:putative ABC transport system permease protein